MYALNKTSSCCRLKYKHSVSPCVSPCLLNGTGLALILNERKKRRLFGMIEKQDENTVLQLKPRKKQFLLFAVILLLISLLGSFALVSSLQSASPEDERLEAIYFQVEHNFQKHFIVSGRPHLMELGLTLVLRDEQAAEVLNTHVPKIKSAVSLQLGEQTFTTLKSLQGRELLKQNILSAVQKIMQEEVGRPGIENVLFTRYTLQ